MSNSEEWLLIILSDSLELNGALSYDKYYVAYAISKCTSGGIVCIIEIMSV